VKTYQLFLLSSSKPGTLQLPKTVTWSRGEKRRKEGKTNNQATKTNPEEMPEGLERKMKRRGRGRGKKEEKGKNHHNSSSRREQNERKKRKEERGGRRRKEKAKPRPNQR
jgi:hypothetical protein